MIQRIVLLAAVTCPVLAWTGCVSRQQYDQCRQKLQKQQDLTGRLEMNLNLLRDSLAAQQKQIDSLLNLGDKRLEQLYYVSGVRLGKHTGGVDLDDAYGHDAVKVYLEPIDQYGSVIKAAGATTISLYDLQADKDAQLVGQCSFSVDETARQWSSGFIVYHYSFVCPWTQTPSHDELTVRVEFTDYLTGKVFSIQKMIKIKLPPAAATQPATAPAETISE